MARNQNRRKFELPPRFKKLRNKTRRARRRRPSTMRTIASTIYQALVALPFIPAPLKSAADVVARQVGLITKSNDVNGTDTAVPNGIYFVGEISANAFVQNVPYSVNDGRGSWITKYTSVRPLSITVVVTPSNHAATRCGYYNVGLIPYTGALDFQRYRKINFLELSTSGTFAGYPIRKRVPAGKSISLTYNVPRSNTFLHMGIKFEPATLERTNGVAMVCVAYDCFDRNSYDDFTPNDFSVDVRFHLKGEFLSPDLTQTVKVSEGNGMCDLIPTSIPLRNFKDKEGRWYDGSGMKYNADRNAFEGRASQQLCMTLEDMAIG